MTTKLLVAAIAITLSGLVGAEVCEPSKICTERFGDWTVISERNTAIVSLMSKTDDGAAAFMSCRIKTSACFLSVTIPSMSCASGTRRKAVAVVAGAIVPIEAVCFSEKPIPTFILLGQDALELTTGPLEVIIGSSTGDVVRTKFSKYGLEDAAMRAARLVVELSKDNGGHK